MIRQTSYYCCSIVLDIGPFYPFTIAADTDIVFIIRTLVYTQIKSAARRHSTEHSVCSWDLLHRRQGHRGFSYFHKTCVLCALYTTLSCPKEIDKTTKLEMLLKVCVQMSHGVGSVVLPNNRAHSNSQRFVLILSLWVSSLRLTSIYFTRQSSL